MRVFVAYGYNDRDKWIENMAIPVIDALGLEVVHGKEIVGKKLSDEIKKKIKSCDLLVGFLTLREDDKFGGHWVRAELDTANAADVPFIPVVENGVDFQANILGDVVYMPYEERTRDEFLVKLIKTVAREANQFAALPKQKKMLIKLDPDTFHKLIKKIKAIEDPYKCTYRFSNTAGDEGIMEESDWLEGEIIPVLGGWGINVDMIYIPVPEHTEKAFVEVKVKYGDEIWISEPHLLSRRPVITMVKIK